MTVFGKLVSKVWKVCYEILSDSFCNSIFLYLGPFYLFLFYFVFWLCGKWDLCSL